jgi:hypothetical protein
MERLDKKIDKLKVASSLNEVSYELQISKLACDYVRKKFPEFQSLEVLKSNKQIIKYIMKIIDTIMQDKRLFTDRKVIKKIDKTNVCLHICKVLLNLSEQETENVVSDIKFIVEEFYKRRNFFLQIVKYVKDLFDL